MFLHLKKPTLNRSLLWEITNYFGFTSLNQSINQSILPLDIARGNAKNRKKSPTNNFGIFLAGLSFSAGLKFCVSKLARWSLLTWEKQQGAIKAQMVPLFVNIQLHPNDIEVIKLIKESLKKEMTVSIKLNHAWRWFQTMICKQH